VWLWGLGFQGVPGHAGLPRNERADSLAKTRATLPVTKVPCPLAPTIAKIRHTRYSLWRQNLSHNSLSCQIPSVSSEEPALPCLIRCELSGLHCHGHSLLLSSYLCKIKGKENSSSSTCGHPQQDLTCLLLDCLASEPLRRAIFGITSSIFDLWSRPWGVARLLGLRGVHAFPHFKRPFLEFPIEDTRHAAIKLLIILLKI